MLVHFIPGSLTSHGADHSRARRFPPVLAYGLDNADGGGMLNALRRDLFLPPRVFCPCFADVLHAYHVQALANTVLSLPQTWGVFEPGQQIAIRIQGGALRCNEGAHQSGLVARLA